MVIVAGAPYYDPGQGTRGGSIILPSLFLPILIYFSIIFCGPTHALLNDSPLQPSIGFRFLYSYLFNPLKCYESIY
jgi:hypothetical protein